MAKHILVVADIESKDTHVLEKVYDITRPFDASLEVVKFIQCSSHSALSEQEQIEQARKSLDLCITSVFDGSIQITSEVVNCHKITDWIVERCQQHDVDLVIKSRHRTESLFHTPTDWLLSRQLSCPILLVSHIKWQPQANLLLALDLSTEEIKHQQLNELILQWGKRWSTVKAYKIHAAYSIPIAKALLELDIVDRNEIEQKKSPQAKIKMQTLLAQFDVDTIPSHITAGLVEKSIPHLAGELHCNLVVIGCLGRQGLSSYFHHNSAEKILHNLHTDCLIVKLPQD